MGLKTAAQNAVKMFAQTRANIACSPKGVRGHRIKTAETQWRIPNIYPSPNELFLRVKQGKYVDSSKEIFLVERNKSSTRIWLEILIFLSDDRLHFEDSPNIILIFVSFRISSISTLLQNKITHKTIHKQISLSLLIHECRQFCSCLNFVVKNRI